MSGEKTKQYVVMETQVIKKNMSLAEKTQKGEQTMFAKIDNTNRSVDVSWYTQQGILETKKIPMDQYGTFEEASLNPAIHAYETYMDSMFEQNGNWIYQPQEVYTLLSSLSGRAEFFPIYLACVFGLSIKELLMLRRKDIDLKYNTLVLRTETKIRTIRLSLEFRDIYFDVLARQEAKFMRCSDNCPEALRLVCLREDNTPFEEDELRNRLRTATDRVDLPTLEFDELRFSSAMMLQLQGYSIMEIWGWLGQQNCWFASQPLANCIWSETA